MRGDLFVYISGPMTPRDGYTIEENVAAGLRMYWTLLLRGIPAFCPHLVGGYPTAWTLMPHAQWVAYDRAVIARCSHVLMLPRWETSEGARLEKAHAEQLGIPVVYDPAALDGVEALDEARA
jgi:hypothetical protein